MSAGLALSFDKLELSELQQLWQAAFPQPEQPVSSFNGLIKSYKVSQQAGLEPAGGFAQALSGNAFDARLELRWRQVAPGRFDGLVLLEPGELADRLTAMPKLTRSAEYNIEAEREIEIATVFAKADQMVDRRFPSLPKGINVAIKAIYYYNQAARQVCFIRLTPGASTKAEKERV